MNTTYKGMSKIFLLVLILILIIVSAVIFGYGGQDIQNVKNDMQDKAQNVIDKKSDVVVEKVIDNSQEAIGRKLKETGEKMLKETNTPGFYGFYGDDEVNNYEKVVLFFTTDWCPSCVNVDKEIEKNKEQIPSNVAIVKVNFDEDGGLRKQYDVNKQHTFVLIGADGIQNKKWQGSKTLYEIINNIK